MVSINVVVTLVLLCLLANLSESFQALSGRRRRVSLIHSEPTDEQAEQDSTGGLNEVSIFDYACLQALLH